MSTEVVAKRTVDPSLIGYPPTFPVEIALQEHSVQEVCDAYGIDKARWLEISSDPVFISDLQAVLIDLRTNGVSFKLKARLQAEAMLKRNWDLVHDTLENVPAAVQADLIKHTVRMAGLDASKDQAAAAAQQNALQININLG